MSEVFFDTETRSPVNLTTEGDDRYTANCQCTMIQWAVDDDEVSLWDPFTDGPELPRDLLEIFNDASLPLIAHNAAFDRKVVARALRQRVPVERYLCTRAQAYSVGLPGSLETLGLVLGLAEADRKLSDGKALIQFFCVPQADGTFRSPLDFPAEWEKFRAYGKQDTATLRRIYRLLPRINYVGENLRQYHVDQLINGRGFGFNQELATAAVRLLEKAKAKADREVSEATGSAVAAVTQRDKLLNYLVANGMYGLTDLRAATIRDCLESSDLPNHLRGLLELRLEASKSSGSKYKKGLAIVGRDSRIRGAEQFSGAGRTGRFSHKGFQPGNMSRPAMTVRKPNGKVELEPVKAKYIDEVVIPAIYSGAALRMPEIYGGPNTACALALRHCIRAAPGNELVTADFSNIEGCITAWVAGEEWKLTALRDKFAGCGPDVYKLLYSKFFGKLIDTINDTERQAGKVIDLSCFAAETEVLTDSGYKAIVAVSESDRLWDGAEWVSHAGLVAKGVRQVVSVDGTQVTPSHPIICNGSWTPAGALALSPLMLSLALESGSANLPYSASPLRLNPAPGSLCAARAAPSTPSVPPQSATGDPRAAISALNGNPSAADSVSGISNTRVSYRTLSTANGCSTDLPQPSTGAITAETGTTTTTAAAASPCAPNGVRTAAHSWCTPRLLAAGITRAWRWTVQTLTAAIGQAISGSSPAPRTCAISEAYPRSSGESRSLKPVYDIALAGPRNRFTIRTNSGHLIVHNCGFHGGVGAFATMSAGYGIDLGVLPALVTEAPEKMRAKAYKAWRTAFLAGRDFELEPAVYQACDILKQLYRTASPAIDTVAYEIDRATKGALESPNTLFEAAKCKIWYTGKELLIQLPSGRRLAYFNPQLQVTRTVDPITGGDLRVSGSISYMTARGKSWFRIKAWMGLFLENIVQAIAADLLRCALVRVHDYCLTVPQIRDYLDTLPEDERTAICLHVHDEIVADVPKGSLPLAKLIELMCEREACYAGLPLHAEGWVNPTYGKR